MAKIISIFQIQNSAGVCLIAVLLLVLTSGCRGLQVSTRSNLTGNVKSTVNGNVNGDVRADVHLNPPAQIDNSQPLEEMTVVKGTQGKIALIDVDGFLINRAIPGFLGSGDNPVSVFREKLDQVEKGCFKAVVLRINTPGGGVTAADIMWRELQGFQERTKIPVVACLMDTATGGGYYLASGADHIIAHPTSVVGGIGVILNLYYMEDLMSQLSIAGVPIKAGSNIDIGSPIKQISDDQRKILQKIAAEFHDRFKKVVITGRPKFDESKKDEVFDGRVFTSKSAMENGLIDNVGYLEDAITSARVLSKCPKASVVVLHRPKDVARTPYSTTANPSGPGILPLSVPGLDRSKMPTFLYLWQLNPTLESIGG